MSKKTYYIQDISGFTGNSMRWWKNDNCGYVCDIRKARVFNYKEAQQICRDKGANKRMWPKKYIDTKISHHIDIEDCNYSERIKSQT